MDREQRLECLRLAMADGRTINEVIDCAAKYWAFVSRALSPEAQAHNQHGLEGTPSAEAP